MTAILMTGASGSMGQMLRTRLAHHDLRLTSRRPADGVEALDVTDRDSVVRACAGVDVILHLGGRSKESSFADIAAVNVHGTQQVLEAAHVAGVPRVIIASSNHVAGLYDRSAAGPDGLLPDDVPAKPDTYYGWGKAAVETLGRLHHDRNGTHVICLRIGSCKERPTQPRDLSTWLSPDDAARLVEASLHATGWHLVWGVSANTRRWWSAAGGAAIGYFPQDDAEPWAPVVGEPDFDDPADRFIGGMIATRAMGPG